MQEEIDEITKKIDEMKMLSGKTWSLKQMEIFRHNLQDRFDRLYNAGKKAYGEDAEYTKEEEHTEEMGYTVISADNLKQMNRFDGEDMENER